jgi:ligand-binding sensor domain-containing protein
VGTESEGVARYDAATDRFERFGETEGVRLLPIRALADDAEGGIWIGSTGGGLTRLDPSKRRSEVWRHDPTSSTSLPDDRISAMQVDRDGHLWVGTWRGSAAGGSMGRAGWAGHLLLAAGSRWRPSAPSLRSRSAS